MTRVRPIRKIEEIEWIYPASALPTRQRKRGERNDTYAQRDRKHYEANTIYNRIEREIDARIIAGSGLSNLRLRDEVQAEVAEELGWTPSKLKKYLERWATNKIARKPNP